MIGHLGRLRVVSVGHVFSPKEKGYGPAACGSVEMFALPEKEFLKLKAFSRCSECSEILARRKMSRRG